MPFQSGSLRLFRLLGVTVYVHWSWALFAIFEIWRRSQPEEPGGVPEFPLYFHVALYLSLFGIVLLHEYGHALACKSVGGKAERIVLWPLGGLAFVQPPPRPGAVLWAIAAGPLVNVVLLPLTILPVVLLGIWPLQWGAGGLGSQFLLLLALMNLVILAFNMLPFYPLDGGQILRSLLWFVCGPGLSLVIAASIGIAGAGLLALVALFMGAPFMALVVAFMGFQCLAAVRGGWAMMQLEKSPRRTEVRCPACGAHPPIGAFWNCPCGNRLDTFETGGRCPKCNRSFDGTACGACGQVHPLAHWYPVGEPVEVVGRPVTRAGGGGGEGSGLGETPWPPPPPVQPPEIPPSSWR